VRSKVARRSGVLLHPSSFPGPWGIGDLGAPARAFIDFLGDSRQQLWQILPLGPTSDDGSPYSSFSSSAGNPLLISIDCASVTMEPMPTIATSKRFMIFPLVASAAVYRNGCRNSSDVPQFATVN